MSTEEAKLTKVQLADLAGADFPNWAREACLAIASQTTNVIVLTGNIDDLVETPFLEERRAEPWPAKPVREFVERLIEDLASDDRASDYRPITETVRVSLALGRDLKGKPAWGPAPAESQLPERDLFRTLSEMHRRFSGVEQASAEGADKAAVERIAETETATVRRPRPPRTLVVLTELEALAAFAERPGVFDRSTVDLLRLWPRAPRPELRRFLVTAYARQPGPVVAALRTAGARVIQIPLPDPQDRRRFLEKELAKNAAASKVSVETLERLVNVTVGLTLRDIRDISMQVKANSEVIPMPERGATAQLWRRDAPQFAVDLADEDMLRHRKSELIVGASQGLLEDVPSQFGFKQVGGLGELIKDLTKLAEQIRAPEGDLRRQLIPRGILLVGAPGTGKTLIARALARESKVNMVKMRDVRAGYVGESERNLTRVLQLVRERRPVIVFVDEIDQAIGRRSSGESRDSGTNERMFGQILEFIGDPMNRGQVIWVAASNRPDHLDSALLSRFDRVFPVLLPDRKGRAEILRAIAEQLRVDYTFEAATPSEADAWTASGWETDANLRLVLDRTDGLSGRALEAIIRRALHISLESERTQITPSDLRAAACEYLRNEDEADYQLQDLLAVRKCNFVNQLPPLESLASRRHFASVVKDGQLDRDALDAAIYALQAP